LLWQGKTQVSFQARSSIPVDLQPVFAHQMQLTLRLYPMALVPEPHSELVEKAWKCCLSLGQVVFEDLGWKAAHKCLRKRRNECRLMNNLCWEFHVLEAVSDRR